MITQIYFYLIFCSFMFCCIKLQTNSRTKRRYSMNNVLRMNFRQQKSRTLPIALRPRPDQEPATPNANRSIRQDYAKGTISLDTIHLGGRQKTIFTWSVLDVFAVKCEQLSISRCLFQATQVIYIEIKLIQGQKQKFCKFTSGAAKL